MQSFAFVIFAIFSLCIFTSNVAIAQPPPPNGGGGGGGTGGGGTGGGGTGGGGSTSNSTTCGITSSSSVISVSVSGGLRTVKSTGCPGYNWTSQTTPNSASYQCHSFVMPSNPIISNNVFYVGVYINRTNGTNNTQMVGGAIGVASNGVSLYGNQDAERRDAYIYEGSSFDTCKGHPQMGGDYHYHAQPTEGCVYTDTAGQHSPLLGFMFDGIPIYGAYGDNGVVPTNLDQCNGHTDNTHSFYHYHLAYNYTYPYLVNCLRGCINGTSLSSFVSSAPCSPATTQYDYSSLASTWVAQSATNYTCASSTSTSTAAMTNVAGFHLAIVMMACFFAYLFLQS